MGTDSEANYSGMQEYADGKLLNSVTTHHHLETGVLFAFEYFTASDQDMTGCATITKPPERSSIPPQ
jgi:hypothetical protein